MNKQTEASKKTAPQTVNNTTILNILLFGRYSSLIRNQYNINTHCITMLTGCYLYIKHINPTFTQTGITKFIRYYSDMRIKKYLTQLIVLNMITQAGTKINHYTLTDTGLQTIAEISNNAEQVLYLFCQKYNIEL